MLGEEESAELAELRRRAWGDDADLLDDPSALARLQELEEKARPPVVSPAPVPEPVVGEARFDSLRSLNDTEQGDPEPVVGEPRFDSLRSLNDPEQGDPEPVVERGSASDRDETRKARMTARRGILLIVGVVITAVALAGGVRSILIPSAGPAASPTPTPTLTRTVQALPALACGDGWGSGSLSTPDGKPVWSRQFDFPISESQIIPADGPRMIGVWANLDVYPGTVSDVEIVSPTTARLFYTAVKNWSAPASPEAIIMNSRTAIVLPDCANPDSYPGFILARGPACVTLEFTVNGTRHYTARTPVGIDEGAHCPAP